MACCFIVLQFLFPCRFSSIPQKKKKKKNAPKLEIASEMEPRFVSRCPTRVVMCQDGAAAADNKAFIYSTNLLEDVINHGSS